MSHPSRISSTSHARSRRSQQCQQQQRRGQCHCSSPWSLLDCGRAPFDAYVEAAIRGSFTATFRRASNTLLVSICTVVKITRIYCFQVERTLILLPGGKVKITLKTPHPSWLALTVPGANRGARPQSATAHTRRPTLGHVDVVPPNAHEGSTLPP